MRSYSDDFRKFLDGINKEMEKLRSGDIIFVDVHARKGDHFFFFRQEIESQSLADLVSQVNMITDFSRGYTYTISICGGKDSYASVRFEFVYDGRNTPQEYLSDYDKRQLRRMLGE